MRYTHLPLIVFALTIFFLNPTPTDAQTSCSCDGNTPTVGSTSGQRGRVKLVNNNLVADNGCPIRGDTPRLYYNREFQWNPPTNFWLNLARDYRLNAYRLLIYREPQKWSGGCGSDCQCPDYYQTGRTNCSMSQFGPHANAGDFDTNKDNKLEGTELQNYKTYVINPITTNIDKWVNFTRQHGIYLVIDYHPVLGHDKFDAKEFWKIIAPRYKDETHVLYEVMNEPGNYPAENIAFQEELYRLIRPLAPDTHLIMWTFSNISEYNMRGIADQAPQINYSNASVGYHIYGYDRNKILNTRQKYPVINTEIGQFAGYKTQVANMERDNLSWFILDGFSRQAQGEDFGLSPTWSQDPFYNKTCQPNRQDLNNSGTVDSFDMALLIQKFRSMLDFRHLQFLSQTFD